MRQLALDLPRRTTFDRHDFLVSDSNKAAVEWIDRWPLWPSAALLVHGPRGCGKTHLTHRWRERAAATAVRGEVLTEAVLPSLLDLSPARIAVDDADHAAEGALLHLYNGCIERRGSLFLTSRSAPASWRLLLADLRSRLRAAVVVGIGIPDDALLSAILVKHFADRQIRVAPEVIAFVVSRMERSFIAAELLASRLDAAALRGGSAVTIPLARRILSELDDHSSSPGSEAAVT